MIKTILLLNPVYVTLFWALVLSFHKRSKHVPKVFLGRFMLVAFILYLSHFFYFTLQYETYYYLDSIYTLASLLVYPMYHIYVRLLTIDIRFTFKLHGKYLFLPFIIFMLHITGYLLMDREAATHYLIYVLPGQSPGEGLTSYMLIVYQLFRAAFILQALIYLYLNYRLIVRHNKRLRDFYSNMEGRNLDWVQFFNFTLAITSLSSVILAFLGRDAFTEIEFGLVFPSLVFSTMLFTIGYLGNIQREINWQKEVQKDKEDNTGGSFPAGMKEKLDRLFEKDMIFRNPDLKIWDVCSLLGTNRTYVSREINKLYGRNFCNHVNHYRIEYARKLIRESGKLDNAEVAELSGFGSVNSLYRAFQTFEGKSLGEFRKDYSD